MPAQRIAVAVAATAAVAASIAVPLLAGKPAGPASEWFAGAATAAAVVVALWLAGGRR